MNGPNIFIKRDDCTGFALGGNKVRQMEFYFGDILDKGADTVISTSATQSNHLRVIAAACAKFGLRCELQRENRVAGMEDNYYTSGNALLQTLFGAHVHNFPMGEDEEAADDALKTMADELKEQGHCPYIIGLGPKYPHLGALGYVDAAREILEQSRHQNIDMDAIVLPSGSAATHAGTLVGLRVLGCRAAVYGISVRRDQKAQTERVLQRVRETEMLIGMPGIVRYSEIMTTDNQLGPGYGQPTDSMLDAIIQLAQTEGIALDPVYSGKAFAGLIEYVRDGTFKSMANVVFIHTGGTPALFAYQSLFQ
jgi:D-cysteine desulfhydrase family pyridoxal phosphate-dependent enzyme